MKSLTQVYLSLLFLLILTMGVSILSLGRWSYLASLLIASCKAGLILFFFMKIRESSPSLRLVALASLMWLFFLFGMTGTDYLTRGMAGVLGK